MNCLSAALIAYVGLGVLTWLTITDTKLRAGTLLILALFAVKKSGGGELIEPPPASLMEPGV